METFDAPFVIEDVKELVDDTEKFLNIMKILREGLNDIIYDQLKFSKDELEIVELEPSYEFKDAIREVEVIYNCYFLLKEDKHYIKEMRICRTVRV